MENIKKFWQKKKITTMEIFRITNLLEQKGYYSLTAEEFHNFIFDNKFKL